MAKKIKVSFHGGNHSVSRGVGFYASNLSKALQENSEVELTDKDPDLIHYPFFDLFYPTLPVIKKLPTIVSIHDLTPLAMADRYPKGVKGTLALLHQRLAVQSLKAIITDSQYSKGDIVKYFNIDFEKVFVTPLAIDPVFEKEYSKTKLQEIKEKHHLPDKFVLVVSGGPNPNKNLPAIADVTKELGIPLVIVGKGMIQEIKEPVHPELIDMIKLKKYTHIIYPGFVSTEDLVGYYQLATIYCQPSLYEGFGLPLLEAMTAQCLVVSSNATSLPEIYHHDAITFDPSDLHDMKVALQKALDLSPKERALQISKAKERSKDFDWKKTAEETVKVYKEVLCL